MLWFSAKIKLMTGIKNTEMVNLLNDGLVCLCESWRSISIKLDLLHNQLKAACHTLSNQKLCFFTIISGK